MRARIRAFRCARHGKGQLLAADAAAHVLHRGGYSLLPNDVEPVLVVAFEIDGRLRAFVLKGRGDGTHPVELGRR